MVESPEQGKAQSNAAPSISLAIIPFRLLRGETKTPLGVGLADALIIHLHAVESLAVLPTGAVLPLAEKIEDSFELGRRLGVDYVLDGHILPAASRTRFSVQLLDIKNQSVLWASQFDETEADIFHLEDSISERIVELLLPQLAEKTNEHNAENKSFNTFFQSPEDTGTSRKKNPENHRLHNSENATLNLPPAFNDTKTKFNRFAIAAIVVAALSIGAIVYFLYSGNKKSSKTATATLVVMPFKSENAATNSVGNGLADALSAKLGAVNSISVLSSSVGREIAKTEGDGNTVARRFGAEYVLRGSLQAVGEQSELETALVNAADGQSLFVERFTAPAGDLLTLQNLAAKRVLAALAIVPKPEELARINKRHTENPLAYELYLVGRFQMINRSPENLRRAIQIFNQAIERDPNFALPYVGLADSYGLLVLYDIPPPQNAYKIAEENALRALALDENLSEAHASLGYVRFNGERNFPAAEKEFRRAIELNPSYPATHHWFAIACTGAGKHDEAIVEIKTAEKLDPTAPAIRTAAGIVYFRARRYQEALAKVAEAQKLNPAFVPAHKTARWIYQAQGDYNRALDEFQKERSYSGATDDQLGWLIIQAQVEALGSNREQAGQLLEKALKDRFVQQNPTSYANEIALAFAALGDRDNAIAWLEKAYQANDHSIVFVNVEPRFDNLRQDPRFISIVQKSKPL